MFSTFLLLTCYNNNIPIVELTEKHNFKAVINAVYSTDVALIRMHIILRKI